MFGTLLSALPWPDGVPEGDLDAAVAAAVAAQVEAGLGVVSDGGFAEATHAGGPAIEPPGAEAIVAAWRRADAAAGGAALVKAVLPGPLSMAGPGSGGELERRAIARADAVAEAAIALAEAGCAIVQVDEWDLRGAAERAGARAFRAAHDRIVERVAGDPHAVHLSLSVARVAGGGLPLGRELVLGPAYASLAVDLIAAPDDWNLVRWTPPSRGVVVSVMAPGDREDEGPELPMWASGYAASTGGRGGARVGLAIGPGLERQTWPVAVRKLHALGEAVRVASLPPGDAKARALDPRAVDIRRAAVGHAPARPESGPGPESEA